MAPGRVDTTASAGPFFRAVDTVTSAELQASGEDVTLRRTPVLVKAATSAWPASRLWDFDYLAAVCGCGLERLRSQLRSRH